MAFHFFSLPESIYTDIINTMNPCEQFFTSLCSRKTYSIIKTHRHAIKNLRIRTEGNFEFHLYDYENTHMKFHQSFEFLNYDLKELIIDESPIPFELRKNNVTTYWKEPREGTMKLIEYLCDLFNIEVKSMKIHYDSGDRLMKWVQRRQKYLDLIQFTSNGREETQFTLETLAGLLMDCAAKDVRLNAYTTQPLQIQNFYTMYHLFTVSLGTWFTLENLMTLDCIDISVTGKQFTSTEMNRFFKHWMSGGSPRLTLLKVKLDNYNERELMNGIDVKWNMSTRHLSTDDGLSLTRFDGFHEIQKTTNGMTAGFKLKNELLCFGVWTSSFYLFRLPHLAFMNIINAMGTIEQFMTSLCSRRAFSTIKTLRRRIEGITLSVCDRCLIIKRGTEELISRQIEEDPKREDIVTINYKSARFVCDKKRSTINTFWAEPITGTMELVEHVTSLFGIRVDKVFVIKKDPGTRFMNWVQSRQKSLRMVEVISFDSMEDQFESEDLKNIIMECEAENIELNALHSSPFEIQNLNKKFEKFECLRGTWITVDNLMSLDCIRITVEERKFTSAEMNRFIKNWIQGGSPRLGVLHVTTAENNIQELFDGLDVRLNNEKMLFLNNHLIEFNGFFEVVRSDGTTAGFKPFPHFFWFGVIIQFYSFLFLLWGISQFGISLFKEKYTGDTDESFSFIMIIEGYGSAFLIAVRSKFAFLLASFYFVIRCAFVINRLSEENPDPFFVFVVYFDGEKEEKKTKIGYKNKD